MYAGESAIFIFIDSQFPIYGLMLLEDYMLLQNIICFV